MTSDHVQQAAEVCLSSEPPEIRHNYKSNYMELKAYVFQLYMAADLYEMGGK
jgi:hypothetical protein